MLLMQITICLLKLGNYPLVISLIWNDRLLNQNGLGVEDNLNDSLYDFNNINLSNGPTGKYSFIFSYFKKL